VAIATVAGIRILALHRPDPALSAGRKEHVCPVLRQSS
jgi:hypothetical protein